MVFLTMAHTWLATRAATPMCPISAVMYMILDGKLYLAEVKTASVKDVAQVYLSGNYGLSDAVKAILQAIIDVKEIGG